MLWGYTKDSPGGQHEPVHQDGVRYPAEIMANPVAATRCSACGSIDFWLLISPSVLPAFLGMFRWKTFTACSGYQLCRVVAALAHEPDCGLYLHSPFIISSVIDGRLLVVSDLRYRHCAGHGAHGNNVAR
ncbi:MAG: hypothetical protein ACLTMA_06185 [Gemmiger formicilis]|uniref:hypothetical protein n=1 Tax=Gemmiger formicilis TaxID=745368 RepID=UPI003A2D7860